MSRKILLSLGSEGKDAVKADIHEVATEMDELKKTVTAEIRADAEQAKREIKEVKGELDRIPKSKTIRIRVEAEQASLKSLETRLASLSSTKNDLEAAGQDTSDVERRMGSLATQIDNTRVRVKNLSADFDRLGQRGPIAIGNIVSHLPLIGGVLQKIATSVGELVSGLLPAAAQGFTGIVSSAAALATVGPIIFAIAAALASLLVTIGLVIAAVAALAVAFVVALVPIGVLLALVGSQIMKVISGTNALKQAVIALTGAYATLAQSIVTLHQDEGQEALQRLAAIQAEHQATLSLTDAQNGLADAILGQKSNELALQSALLNRKQLLNQLTGFGMNPASLLKRASGVDVTTGGQKQTGADPLGYDQLQIAVKQSNQTVAQARQAIVDGKANINDARSVLANAAQTEAQFVKQGLKAFDPYLQSVQKVAGDLVTVAANERAVTTAILARDKASQGMGKNTSAFMTAWSKLKTTISEVFGPAEQAVFAGIDQALTILSGHGKSLAPAFKILGDAIGGAFVQFAKWLTSPKTLKDLGKIIRDAAGLTTALAGVFTQLLTIITQIAKDVLPSMVTWIQNAGKVLQNVVQHPKAIAHFLHLALHDLGQFGKVISGFLGMVKTLASYWHTIAQDVGVVKNFAAPKTTSKSAVKNLGGIPYANSGLDPHPTVFQKLLNVIGGLAGGGVVTGPGAYMIGEGGAPEGVIPLAGGGAEVVAKALSRYFTINLGALFANSQPHLAAAAGVLSPGSVSHIHHNTNNFANHIGGGHQDPAHVAVVVTQRQTAALAAQGSGYK